VLGVPILLDSEFEDRQRTGELAQLNGEPVFGGGGRARVATKSMVGGVAPNAMTDAALDAAGVVMRIA
jgi:hypothetical protein